MRNNISFLCRFILICLLIPCLSKADPAAKLKAKIQPAYQAASYLQVVFDQLIEKKTSAKFCNIKTENASMYLQMVKAKIDQAWKEVPTEELPMILKFHATHLDAKCIELCTCEFYYDVVEKIKDLPADKEHPVQIDSKYRQLYQKQNNQKCFTKTKNFCQSPLFKEIASQVKKND